MMLGWGFGGYCSDFLSGSGAQLGSLCKVEGGCVVDAVATSTKFS